MPSPNSSLNLTPLELDLMKVVWRRPHITVREVRDAIRPFRPLAYTTVMTILHRLYLKGFLRRELHARTYYYEPSVAFADVRNAVVSGVMAHFFEGSRRAFVQFLEGEPDPPPAGPVVHDSPPALDETLL